ncbi:hypothetical protein O3M35_010287 [Rhynocoris fuscipes]|uniref:Uncharacterized protein n=1 Tax=Rhynocoris fuscipes TaxID=488301 RepID=A0AAW1CYP4_9HEMI
MNLYWQVYESKMYIRFDAIYDVIRQYLLKYYHCSFYYNNYLLLFHVIYSRLISFCCYVVFIIRINLGKIRLQIKNLNLSTNQNASLISSR